ncbi:uncharacterized protein LOC135501566 isoform X2 [Lineus longissimus]|uniref:uncharacterized protein LOC135501566 isoform X2 n=1 Tax=Lineus longissimus TaxID=88925 RepID=UPI002B4DAE25
MSEFFEEVFGSSSSDDDYDFDVDYKKGKSKRHNKGKKAKCRQQHAPPPQHHHHGPPPAIQGHGQPPHAQTQMMQNQWQQEQHYQQYQHFSQQSQVYGSYGNQFQQNVFSINPSQALAFNTEQEFQRDFNEYANPTLGGIQAEELHNFMNRHPKIKNQKSKIKNFYGISWSMELCKIMIMMLDRNKDGIMQYGEFKELLQCLLHWHQLFTTYDLDRSGFVEANELLNITMRKFGYNLSQKAVTTLLKRYSRALDDGRCLIAFDDFVALSVRLRAYTEAFRARDRMNHNGQETGRTEFGYDDFIQCVMCL